MDILILKEFFKYCTIINVSLLVISTITLPTDLPYSLHTKFGLWEGSKVAHKQLCFSILGQYKILIIIFNVASIRQLIAFKVLDCSSID